MSATIPPPKSLDTRWFSSPVDQFIDLHYQTSESGHFHRHYPEWRMRRSRKVLDILGTTDFRGKKFVELGSGHGDIGALFAELGADVLSVEGRAENVRFANLKYRHLSSFTSIQRDLEQDFSDLGKFDYVISFGSLEVIDNIDQYMRSCCALADTLFFETYVIDSEDPHDVNVWRASAEHGVVLETNDQTLHGRATSPSPAYVERVFKENGFTAVRQPHADLVCGPHVYGPTGKPRSGTRYFWKVTRQANAR